MPFKFLEDIATADIAFRAWGKTREEMFASAADAVMRTMIEDLAAIEVRQTKTVRLQSDSLEMLLFEFLQEFIFFKDAEQLLLRPQKIEIHSAQGLFHLDARLAGEVLESKRHPQNVDVKAVTLHRFSVRQTPAGWEASVVLDI